MPERRVPTIIFETSRLVVRHIESTDGAAMHAVYGDADAMQWVGDGQPLSRARCEEWIEVTQRNYTVRGYGMSALLDRESDTVVGFCGLVHPGGQAEAEIKYALRREAWGRGLATEAVAAMLAYGAAAFGIGRVRATSAPENTVSHRVLLKAGMQFDELRHNDDGTFTQTFVWVAPEAQNA